MSKIDLWNRAAAAMRQDEDPAWQAVGDWLRAEATVHAEMEPFVELLNVCFEQQHGVKSYIRFMRDEDGDPQLFMDTNEGATAVALAYLGEEPSRDEQPLVPSDQNPS